MILSRQLPGGSVAFASFLVDRFCLGVKDAVAHVLSRSDTTIRSSAPLESRGRLIPVTPADALKLVQESVAYAQRLGIAPHPDYLKAKPLFGDVDAATSRAVYEFGIASALIRCGTRTLARHPYYRRCDAGRRGAVRIAGEA